MEVEPLQSVPASLDLPHKYLTVRQLTAACPELLNLSKLEGDTAYIQPFYVAGLTETVANPAVKQLQHLREASLQRLNILNGARRAHSVEIGNLLRAQPIITENDSFARCANPSFSIDFAEMALYLHLYMYTDDVDKQRHGERTLHLLQQVYDNVLGRDSALLQSMRLVDTPLLPFLRRRELRRLRPGMGGSAVEGIIDPVALPVTVDEVFEMFQELTALTLRRSMRRLGPFRARSEQMLLSLEAEEANRIAALTYHFSTQLSHPLLHNWWREYMRLSALQHPERAHNTTPVLQQLTEEEELEQLRERWQRALGILFPNSEATAAPGQPEVGESTWNMMFDWTKSRAAAAAADANGWWRVALTDDYLQKKYRNYLELAVIATATEHATRDLLLGVVSLEDKVREELGVPPTEVTLNELAAAWTARLQSILLQQTLHFDSLLRETYRDQYSTNESVHGIEIPPQLIDIPKLFLQAQSKFLLQLVSIPSRLPPFVSGEQAVDNEEERAGREVTPEIDQDGLELIRRWEDHLVKTTAELYRKEALRFIPGAAVPALEPAETAVISAEDRAREALYWFLNWGPLHSALMRCLQHYLLRLTAEGDTGASTQLHALERKMAEATAGELTRNIKCAGETIERPALYTLRTEEDSPLELRVEVQRRPGPGWSSPIPQPPYTYEWKYAPELVDVREGDREALPATTISENGEEGEVSNRPARSGIAWRTIRTHTTNLPTDSYLLVATDDGFGKEFRGRYRCTVTARIQDESSGGVQLASAESAVATVVVKRLCVRCGDWYEPGKNRNPFGSCRWRAPTSRAESRELSGDYRGLLEEELQNKLSLLQTELEHSQERLLYSSSSDSSRVVTVAQRSTLLKKAERLKQDIERVAELPHFGCAHKDSDYVHGFLARLKLAVLSAEVEAASLGPELRQSAGLPAGSFGVVDSFLKAYPLFLPPPEPIPSQVTPNTLNLEAAWRQWYYEGNLEEEPNPVLQFASYFPVKPAEGPFTYTTLNKILEVPPDLGLLLRKNPEAAAQLPLYAVIQLALFPSVKRHLIRFDIQFVERLKTELQTVASFLTCTARPQPIRGRSYGVKNRYENTMVPNWESNEMAMTNIAARIATASPMKIRSWYYEAVNRPDSEGEKTLLLNQPLFHQIEKRQLVAQAKQNARTGKIRSISSAKDLRPGLEPVAEWMQTRSATILMWSDRHSRKNPFPTPWDVVSGVRGSMPLTLLPEKEIAAQLNSVIIELRLRWLRDRIERRPGLSPEDKEILLQRAEQQRVRLLDDDDLKDAALYEAKTLALQFNSLQRKLLRET